MKYIVCLSLPKNDKRVNGSYKLICDLAFINDLEPDAKHGSIIRNLFLVNKPNKGQNSFST